MQGKSLAQSLTTRTDFVVVAELAAGPGFNFAPIERFLGAYREASSGDIPAGFDFVAVTVPQNPGGVANLEPADVLARVRPDLLGPLDFVPHVSCKDHNRDAITSSLVSYQARGISSLLALTGDKPASSRGVFDIESVGLLQLVERMNYTAYLKAAPGQWDKVQQFFPGAAVSPFKYTEASQMQQYFKMEKKVASGAQFLITQVGWDWRKSLELMRYLKERSIDIPVLGNVYLLTTMTPAPRLMHDLKLPGCFVSDELLAQLKKESIDDHIERAAQQVAMYKALGAAGVDVGGLPDYATFVKILQRAAQIGKGWEQYKSNLSWPGGAGFYLYDESRKEPAPIKRSKPLRRRAFNVMHRLALDPDHIGFKVWRGCMKLTGAQKGEGLAYKSFATLEKAIKYAAFDCQDCGDCYLPENFGFCTRGKCEKGLNNAPCGDSTVDGRCGNNPEARCTGERIYETAAAEPGGVERLRKTINQPRNPDLEHTSSILNYLAGRDHTKASPLIAIGDQIDASHPKIGAIMKEALEVGDKSSQYGPGPVGYIKALIQSQADERADYIAVNVDALCDGDGQRAAQIMKTYITLIEDHGAGIPPCIDSVFHEALTAGLEAWYADGEPVRRPLVSSTSAEAINKVMPLRKDYDFGLVGPLGKTSGGALSAADAFEQAKGLYERAVGKYGFKAEQLFFNPVVVPLIKDVPTQAHECSYTHSAFETMRMIKSDSSLKKCRRLLRTSVTVPGLPGRAVGVCRAYVAKALEYGLDAAFTNVANHYGESPADPGLIELVTAFAQMDGTSARTAEAKERMDKFCAANRKPPRQAPTPSTTEKETKVIPIAAGARQAKASQKPQRAPTERAGSAS